MSCVARTMTHLTFLLPSKICTLYHHSRTLVLCCSCQRRSIPRDGNLTYSKWNQSYMSNSSSIGIFNDDGFKWLCNWLFGIQRLHHGVVKIIKRRRQHVSVCYVQRIYWRYARELGNLEHEQSVLETIYRVLVRAITLSITLLMILLAWERFEFRIHQIALNWSNCPGLNIFLNFSFSISLKSWTWTCDSSHFIQLFQIYARLRCHYRLFFWRRPVNSWLSYWLYWFSWLCSSLKFPCLLSVLAGFTLSVVFFLNEVSL